MKKILKSFVCMAIITIALCALCSHFAGFHQTGAHYYSQQLSGVANWLPVFLVVAFFTGFLPAYIYETVKDMQPKAQVTETAQDHTEQPREDAPIFTVGQVFSSPGTNCYVRIKSLKNIAA